MQGIIRDRDPLGWCVAIALGFAAIAGWNLAIPHKMYFDEVHYVPAARALLALHLANAEHPLVGKEAIALAIRAFGDRPVAWRLPSAAMGTAGLFAFGRALWWASGRRFASLAGMVLLATDFAWFVQSRIAMLDMVMAGFAMVALWQVAAALRSPAQGRRRLGLAGVAFGLALGAKWTVVPVIGLVAWALTVVRVRAAVAAGDLPIAHRQAPIPGMSLAEMLFWLLSVPIAVYAVTFLPGFFYRPWPIDPSGLLAWQRYMLELQESVVTRHPYQSVWYQWVIDWRPVWYLYERVDGAQRGIVLVGNPLTMLAGLPALGWGLWAGWRGRTDAGAAAGLYFATLGMWMVSTKPVQFYYHYLLPGAFLMAGLALALDRVWRRPDRWRWMAPVGVAASVVLFGYFYPIIVGAPLHQGTASFEHWMWLASWR